MCSGVNRHTLLVALSVLLAQLASAEASAVESLPNTLSESERTLGWRLLFDGKTTRGWRGFGQRNFPVEGWVIEDGCLKHKWRGGGGDIVTEEVFDEFEFEFEWKLTPKSNSGMKYFVLEERNEPLGHEYQVIDDPAYGFEGPDNKYQTASFYGVLAPTVYLPPRPPGQFNQSRVLVRGSIVEHWLNGVKVLEYQLDSPQVREAVSKSKFKSVPGFGSRIKGRLLLQDHGGEVCYRNLRIRPRSALEAGGK